MKEIGDVSLELFKQEVASAIVAFSNGRVTTEIAEKMTNGITKDTLENEYVKHKGSCWFAKELLTKFCIE